tara:strand:- start:345 stop:974 length:630 start_codon:yes stop_codon:yes gene_type:complete
MAGMRNINFPYPDWKKVPWGEGYEYEHYNPNKTNAMFKLGDLINEPTGQALQVVHKKFGINVGVEWWYQVTSYFGRNSKWFKESDLNKYAMTREWVPIDKEFINPANFEKVFTEGDSVSLLFDKNKPTAKTYRGTITKKIEDWEFLRGTKTITYTITFEDGDVKEFDHYRLLWMLELTARYLDDIPIAVVGEYSGADIPIALPGLKLRF